MVVRQLRAPRAPQGRGFDGVICGVVEGGQVLFACQVKVTEEQRLIARINPDDRLHGGWKRRGGDGGVGGRWTLCVGRCGGRQGNRDGDWKRLAGSHYEHKAQPGCFFCRIHTNLITDEMGSVNESFYLLLRKERP